MIPTPFQTRWKAHFDRNREHRPEPCWQAPVRLAPGKTRRLARSLAQFQLGDGGGPAELIGWDKERWLDAEPGRRDLVALWFGEEKEHSRLLGRAVARFRGRPVHGHWSFSVFCAVRRWGGVRFELTALLLTEIAASVYYRMLERHVPDPAVREMARLILRDEAGHIAFHRERLALPLATGQRIYGRTWEIWFRTLGCAAGTMLWINHRGAFIPFGVTTADFHAALWRELSSFVRLLRREAETCRKDLDLELLGDFLDLK